MKGAGEQAKAINKRARATKEKAKSAAARAVKEYKDSDDFKVDATAIAVGIYVIEFGDCKKKAR